MFDDEKMNETFEQEVFYISCDFAISKTEVADYLAVLFSESPIGASNYYHKGFWNTNAMKACIRKQMAVEKSDG
jgi:hypothetical protein